MYSGKLLNWPIERSTRTFRVQVVEPSSYEPASHGEIFNAVLSNLISPPRERLDGLGEARPRRLPDSFDLITFPEAFISTNVLIEALRAIAEVGSMGCVHVGLRPDDNPRNHLFSHEQAGELIAAIRAVSESANTDLEAVAEWFRPRQAGQMFNFGCLFTVDAERRVRVCLHPKINRSRFEVNPLPELHMEEADFLSLVTLNPKDKRFQSITLQPLICSDALNQQRDRIGSPPIIATSTDGAQCFGDFPPDHVDIVSVATCTPQPQARTENSIYRAWHRRFQDAFTGTAGDGGGFRHYFASFVLSNFLTLEENTAGGLSGVFMPIKAKSEKFHDAVVASLYGKPGDGQANNEWSPPAIAIPQSWSSKGFLANLDPFSGPEAAIVKVFGFTIQRLPRDHSPWATAEALTRCEVRVGVRDEQGRLSFENWGVAHA